MSTTTLERTAPPKCVTPYRIWIGCLCAYNAGSLHGFWCDAEPDAVEECLEHLRATCPAKADCHGCEEAIVMDVDGIPGLAGHEPSIDEALAVTSWLEMLEDYEQGAAAALLEEEDLEQAQRYLAGFVGHYSDFAEFAQGWGDCSGDIPAHLVHFIDWAAYGESLLDDYHWISTGLRSFYVFHNI